MDITGSAHSRTLARRTLALVLAGGRGSRVVFRLSGTGTEGATLRV